MYHSNSKNEHARSHNMLWRVLLVVLMNVGSLTVLAQGKVSGAIVDASGEPVIGATVKVQGSHQGTVSDLNGEFSLSVAGDGVLTVSFVGYKSQDIAFKEGQQVKVVLLEDSNSLSEIVVVGFGTQKKVNLTGAVGVVDGDELAERPVQNAAMALQGLVPGLQISSSTGALDGKPSINVRGTATIGEGTNGSPLILIDGSEGDINTLNPQDIESISVLKDAAASSIYGSRAPFGVILITTKSGKAGKVTINYNNSFRFSSLIRGKSMMNSVDYACWMNNTLGYNWFGDERMNNIVAYHNGTPTGPGQRLTPDGRTLYAINSSNGTTWDEAYGSAIDDVDWYGVVYRNTAFSQEHNASVSGGSELLTYYASVNYLHNGGFMKIKQDKYDRYNGTAKISSKLTKWLYLNYNMRFTRTDFSRPANLTESLYSDMARQGWPMLPLYDRNGYYYSAPSPALGLATRGSDTTQRDIINHRVGLVIEPVKDWVTHVDLNYNIENNTRQWYTNLTYNHNVAGEPVVYDKSTEVYESEQKNNYLNFQAYTEYSLSLAEKHNIHLMAGFQTEQMKQLFFSAQRQGVLDPSKPELDLTSGLGYDGMSIVPGVSGNRNQWQTAGFFGRLNYNYDEKYLVEFNIRKDGTSRFRRDKMWKTFPSASIGWNIARENFFKSASQVVNLLKLRASYGSLGNQNTDAWYLTYQTVTYSPASGSWLQNGVKPNTTSAPNLVSALLTWETVKSYDIGLDWGLFNNRLTGSFDWYIRDTKDMVGNAPELPAILGTAVPVTNNTDLRTKGWELQIGWRNVLQNGLSYGIRFNLADTRTKITRYPNNPTGNISTYVEGRYINEIWGFETEGLAKTDEEMNAHIAKADQSAIGSNWSAGDIMYKDINGDGKITGGAGTIEDHGDRKVIGNSTPRFLYGLDLNAAWKGFDLRAFFQGVAKRDFWEGSTYMFGATNSGQWWCTGITGVADYFRNDNSWSVQNGYQTASLDAYLPRPLYSDKNLQTQTRYLLNAAYMRLKNLQLGYTLPQKIIQNIGINNARVYISAENLFTITNLPDQFDPETIGTDRSNGYPLSKTFSFGINITL